MGETVSIGKAFFMAQDRLRGGPDEALCAPEYSFTVNDMPTMDLAGHQGFASVMYAGFPDMKHVIDSVKVAGTSEIVEFRLVGTHQADFMGIPATAKSIDVPARVQLEVTGGKVKSITGTFDQSGMLAQLGVTPAAS